MSANEVNTPPLPAADGTIHAAGHQFVSAAEPKSPDYPRPRVPVAPVLSWSSFGTEAGQSPPSVLDAGQVRHVTSGRVAIAMALRALGIGPGDKVLVPSYHCASMIEPVIWSGATPVFYRVTMDTSVDFADIESKIDASTKLLCAANYFGFPQPLARIRALCDARGLAMLEDCAHCFFGAQDGTPVGSTGDYAIASSMKFFPIYEGGLLVSARHSLDGVALRNGGLGFQAKIALDTLEECFQFGRMAALKWLLRAPMMLKSALWKALKSRRPVAASMAPGSSQGGFGFDPAWLNVRSAWFTRFVMAATSRRRIGALRRAHYQALQQALAGLPGCRPLFPSLPEQVYPWGFPVWADNPQPVFASLKQQGVPIIRFAEFLWAGVDAEVCPSSVALSRHVLLFPCHQEIQAQELAWMIESIQAAFHRHCAAQP